MAIYPPHPSFGPVVGPCRGVWERVGAGILLLIAERMYLCGRKRKFPPAGGQYLGAEIPVFTLKGYATPFVCLELHLIALQMLPFNYINNYTRATLPHKHKNLNHLQHDEEQREKDARSYASQ